MADLTFHQLRRANGSRVSEIHDSLHTPWTSADWSNAMCGEAGEAANEVKKIRRLETLRPGHWKSPEHDVEYLERVDALAHELADTIIYLDILAEHYEIDLAKAVVEKFNLVSERKGASQRLELCDLQPVPAVRNCTICGRPARPGSGGCPVFK